MTGTLLWVGLSIIGAITMAGMALVSEVHKEHATVPRLFWLRVISLIAISPLAAIVTWPDNPTFYWVIFGLSLLICISDALYYGAAKDHGAGATTRIEPLSVLMTFIAWTAIAPLQLEAYLHRPFIEMGIVLCFVAAGFFAMRLRHCKVSYAVMKKLFPVILIMAVVAMLGKIGMDAGGPNPFNAAVAYIIVQVSVLIVFYGLWALFFPSRVSLKPNKALLGSAGLMAFFSVVHIMAKNSAYTMVSNPAYVLMMGLTAPLFVSGYYRLTARRDEADVWAGFGIVLSAVALIALTRF